MTEKMLRCAVYTRKSTDEGLDQDFNSLDAQREACEAYVRSQQSQGWRILNDRFDDGGYSGGDMNRPALQQLISRLKTKGVNVIVVYKIDRLTRSLADFARLVEVFDEYDVSFVSVTQQFNTTTSMGRLTLNVLLSFAQFEREVTSERIRDKVAASKRRGMWMGGHPPLGYDILDRRLVVHPREAEEVGRIFRIALEERSLSRLAARLRREGFRAKCWKTQTGKVSGGGPLTRTTLARLLRNPLYIGKVAQVGALHDGAHEAIIDEALWRDVQAMLDEARQVKKPALRQKANAILSGLLFDDAGNRMVPTYSRKADTTYYYYASLPHIRGSGRPVGTLSRVSAPRVEAAVLKSLKSDRPASGTEPPSQLLHAVKRIVLTNNEIEIFLEDKSAPLRVTASLASPMAGNRLIEEEGANQRNEALIRAITLAHAWRSCLETGEHSSARAIAAAKGYSERYVQKILRLAYLAPDIVEAILEGRQPSHLTLHDVNVTQLPGDWRSQRRALGFENRT